MARNSIDGNKAARKTIGRRAAPLPVRINCLLPPDLP